MTLEKHLSNKEGGYKYPSLSRRYFGRDREGFRMGLLLFRPYIIFRTICGILLFERFCELENQEIDEAK